MSLVTLLKVSLSFVRKQIFHEIGFQVDTGDRIGLVGPNGSGKTTLLRILMGEVPPDSGEVRVARGSRIGYLPQDIHESLSGPLLESLLDSVPGRAALNRQLRSSERSLENTSTQEAQSGLAKNLAEIHQEISLLELQYPTHEAEKILGGLGFKTADFATPISSLSGGWKMRAALAGLLYQKPDLLLLDEPTNHLDIPSVRWVEEFLQSFRGAMILVSHDRDFFNRQVNRIISFEPEGMRKYNGNYDFYLKTRDEEKKSLEATARNQEQKIRDAKKFIERFRAKASKARQAQSKIKLLKKIELVQTRHRERAIRFTFPTPPRSGREVVSLKSVSKGFERVHLYGDLELTVLRGERIAIIGPNGCGKTTLLRMVAGEIEPDEGKIVLGHGVGIGYFAQHHSEMLNPRKTVIQEVSRIAQNETMGFLRSVLGAFLFRDDEVDKPIGILSGGEKARVSLAKLLVKPKNLMVMDEPTNHLDISSSEKLIDALAGYDGTLLFVSHNQSFINRLATKIWDIQEGEIIEYPGNLDEYYDHLERAVIIPEKDEGKPESDSRKGGGRAGSEPWKATRKRGQNRKEQKRERAEKRRLIRDTLEPIVTAVEQLESMIATLESGQTELEKMLADTEIFRDKSRSLPMINEYNSNRKKLDALLSKWEEQQDKLEATKRDMGI